MNKLKFIIIFFLYFNICSLKAYPTGILTETLGETPIGIPREIPKFYLTFAKCQVKLNINLPNKAKISWKNAGDIGFPTKIDLINSNNIKDFHIEWPFPKQEKFKSNEYFYYYSDLVTIPLNIIPLDYFKPIDLKMVINYAICSEKCIPIKQNLEQKLDFSNCQPSYPLSVTKNKTFKIEDIIYNKQKSKLTILVQFNEGFNNTSLPKFLIEPLNDIIFPKIKVKKKDNNYYKIETIISNEKILKLKEHPLILHSDSSSKAVRYNKEINIVYKKQVSYSNIFILIMALLGGFILNFMPCVFPVLSIKILSILKANHSNKDYSDRYKVKFTLLISALGIIFTFLCLGALSIILKNTGYEVFLGKNFQQPNFIIFLCLALTFFISSAQDRINLNFPNLIGNKIAFLKFDNHYLEAFSSGVLASLLSTPCTAPFLGTALSFAFTAKNSFAIIIFLFIGIGFALPYLFLAFIPRFMAKLPRSGKWTGLVKKISSLLLVGTLIWLLFIYSTQRNVFSTLGLTGILILIKFTLEYRKGIFNNLYIKATTLTILIISLFYFPNLSHNQEIRLKNTNQTIWRDFDPNIIPSLLSSSKVIIVDVTADWCVTCKYNKFMKLDQPRILKILAQKDIIAMRADFTNYNEKISFFLKRNNIYGVPFNIIYGPNAPEGIKLDTLFSFKEFEQAIEKARK